MTKPARGRQTAAEPLPPARQAAAAAVSASLAGADLQAALDQALLGLRAAGADPRDAALATELAYGYMRLKGRIDFLLDGFLKNPARLPVDVRLLLGLAAYELTRLRIPAYATVDWAVNAVRDRHGGPLAGLANAVLRNVQRLGAAVDDPDYYRRDRCSLAVFLSRCHACPEWIARMALEAFGDAGGAAFLAASATPPPLGVRVNLARPGGAELAATLAKRPDCVFADGPALAFSPGSQPLPDDAYAQGLASRQSAAAQQALWGLEPQAWPAPVWDACCGRGGKILALAERSIGPLLGSDPNARRMRQARTEFARLGLPLPPLFRARADAPPLRPGRAHSILLDAPCSGLGVLARRPDSKWKRRPEDIPALLAVQRAMLDAALRFLPSGGTVAYITCTINPAENQQAVAQALAAHPRARLDREFLPDPANPLGEFFYGALMRVS